MAAMKSLVFGMLLTSLALAADALPYDLKRAKTEGCLVGTTFEKKISAADAQACASAVEEITYALRYSYGVGERPEEDGCTLGDLKMQFLVGGTSAKLMRNREGQLRGQITCFPDSQPAYLWYIDYDPAAERVLAVIRADL